MNIFKPNQPNISIGDNILSATLGSILFAGTNGALTQNNANLFWDNTNNRLGIGTTSPQTTVQIHNITSSQLYISGNSTVNSFVARYSTDATSANYVLRKYRGSYSSASAVTSGDVLGQVQFQGYGGTNERTIATILAAVDTFTSDTDISSYLSFYTTPALSVTNLERLRIDKLGQIMLNGPESAADTLIVYQSASGSGINLKGRSADNYSNLRFVNNAYTVQYASISANATVFDVGSTASIPMTFSIGGAEKGRIDTSGNLLLGTTTATGTFNIYNSSNNTAYLNGDSTVASYLARHSTDATGADRFFRKSRGTAASLSAVASSDVIGRLLFQVYGGSNYRSLSLISSTVETYTSDTNISTYVSIFTSASGGVSATEKMRITGNGNIVLGSLAALATNATDGFTYIPTSAGAPTGTPTAYTGKVAMEYDTTNNKLYVYNGAWKSVTLA